MTKSDELVRVDVDILNEFSEAARLDVEAGTGYLLPFFDAVAKLTSLVGVLVKSCLLESASSVRLMKEMDIRKV